MPSRNTLLRSSRVEPHTSRTPLDLGFFVHPQTPVACEDLPLRLDRFWRFSLKEIRDLSFQFRNESARLGWIVRSSPPSFPSLHLHPLPPSFDSCFSLTSFCFTRRLVLWKLFPVSKSHASRADRVAPFSPSPSPSPSFPPFPPLLLLLPRYILLLSLQILPSPIGSSPPSPFTAVRPPPLVDLLRSRFSRRTFERARNSNNSWTILHTSVVTSPPLPLLPSSSSFPGPFSSSARHSKAHPQPPTRSYTRSELASSFRPRAPSGPFDFKVSSLAPSSPSSPFLYPLPFLPSASSVRNRLGLNSVLFPFPSLSLLASWPSNQSKQPPPLSPSLLSSPSRVRRTFQNRFIPFCEYPADLILVREHSQMTDDRRERPGAQ